MIPSAHAERRNRDIDWPAMENDDRAGVLSLRNLAQKHDCAHSTIANFATRHGWARRVAQTAGDCLPGQHRHRLRQQPARSQETT